MENRKSARAPYLSQRFLHGVSSPHISIPGFVLGALCTATMLLPTQALADTATAEKVVHATGKPASVEAVSIQTTATVESVDQKARKVTLRTGEGNVLKLDVGPEVQRLDEIKKGDLLEVEYLESVAVAVLRPGDKPAPADGAYSVLVRNPTKNPSGRLTDTETMSATVESVDLEKRVVELLREDGSRVKVPVSPEVKRLAEVAKGDTVTVQYTRSVALSVHKPASAKPAAK